MLRRIAPWLIGATVVLAGCPKEEVVEETGLTELATRDTVEGTGPEIATGDWVTIEYVGHLEDGREFDRNTDDSRPPFGTKIGSGMAVTGFEQGLVGAKLNGEREIDIPSDLGYASEARGIIPPNSDLFFSIKVIDVVKEEDAYSYDQDDVQVGTGPAVEHGDLVEVHLVGTYVNGFKFEDTRERGWPGRFYVGQDRGYRAIDGLHAGVVGMQVGGVRKLRIPPDLAFGASGNVSGFSGELVRGGLVLYLEVELMAINPE